MSKHWFPRRSDDGEKRKLFGAKNPASRHYSEYLKEQGKKSIPKAERHKLRITFVGEEGRKWRLAVLGAVVLLVIIILAATLKEEPQLMSMPEVSSVKARGILKVGVREDMPALSDDGRGMEIDLGLMLAERILPEVTSGNAVKYVTVTKETAVTKLQDGSVDVVCALMPKGGVPQYAYSNAYFTNTCRFIIRNDTQIEAKDITIGVIQSSPDAALLKAYIDARPSAYLTAQNFASYDDMLTALSRGRIDAAVITDVYMEMYEMDYPVTATSVEIGTVDYAFMCASDNAAITEIANLMISELQASGELDRMYARYDLPAVKKTSEP